MKNKFAKLLAVAVLGTTIASSAIGFTACKKDNGGNNGGGGGDEHVHQYAWVDDDNGTTHHEHCGVDGCDTPDKAPENHTWSADDQCNTCGAYKPLPMGASVVPEYKGEAAGPVAGEQKFTSKFLADDLPKGVIAEAYSNGVVTIPAGTNFRDQADKSGKYINSVQNGTISIKVPAEGKLKIYFSSGSGTVGNASYKIQNPDNSSETQVINADAKVLQTLEIDAVPGTYVFSKAAGTVNTYAIEFEYSSVATPIKEIEITNSGTTDYLVTQKVDCTGVELLAKDEGGATYPVKLENCKFDTSNYNPNKSGEYEIGVTYYLSSNLDSETKEFKTTYKVKVYMVDSIELSTIGLASNKQVTVQQACLPNATFNSNYLSVIATCSLGTNSIQQKLKSDWVTVSTPTLTAEGTQEVTVSVSPKYTTGHKAVSASYSIVVKAKKEVIDNKVEVTVGETGEFKTLTQAVQYLSACKYDNGVNKVIKLQAGTYTEKVWLDIDNVTLIGLGEKIDDTVLSYSLVEGDADKYSNVVWGLTCATLHVTGNNFKAYNLAIRNDFDYMANNKNYSGSQAAQGVALTMEGDGNVLYNCHLFGNQDTLYMKSGRSYFKDSQIDGNIDFIFGGEKGLAYFEECDIVAIDREGSEKSDPQNGYVTAPQHKEATKPDYGYIFYKCNLTDDGNVNAGAMALGRPWGPSATVAYIECSFSAAYSQEASDGSHKIHRWCEMSGAKPENADYKEYGSTGDGAITSAVKGGTVIDATAAANFTKANIFGTSNGKSGYTTVFDCDGEYAKLRILAGLDEGEIPTDPNVSITVKNDDTIPDGNCGTTINERYGEYLTWEGMCKFQASKPENGIQVDKTTVITIKVVGEVSISEGYQLPTSDYIIIYKDGKATIKFVAVTGTYGDFIGSIVIDTSKTPEDTQTVNVTVDYNYEGSTADTLEAVVGSPLAKPADPVRDGYKFTGWQVNGVDYDFTENVTEALTLVAQWASQNDYDLTAGGTVNLYEFTTGTVQSGTATYRGIIVDATTGKYYPRDNDVQVNAGVKIKFKVNAGTTADKISVSFTAAAGSQYVPTIDPITIETIDGDTYAVVSITNACYP
ncbi:MAG: InlB B-repeat-containing protein, partial [Clostridia bacterium]|nr:InlB B-repeat-containing protein [Clostridia bacterium]